MTKNFITKYAPEWTLVGLTLGLGTMFAWYVWSLGMVRILIDQTAHLNISRQVGDSLTPGITQLGFWPPLLHVIMAPFAFWDALYQTGLAGAVVLIPVLALGIVFLYKILFYFSDSRLVSFLGATLLLLNPYILYYAVTPMTEVLFITLLLGTAWMVLKWIVNRSFPSLVGAGIFVVLATLARFEGIVLLPLVAIIVITTLWMEKKKFQEIEGTLILFGFVACLGVVFILAYGWFFGDDPLAFVRSNWSAFSQQQDYLRPTQGKVLESLQYMVHASFYMFGKLQFIIGILSIAALLFVFPRFYLIAVMLLLVSPFLFNWFSLYQGNTIIYIEDFPPYNWFYNERYGLYGVALAVMAPAILAGIALRGGRNSWIEKSILGVLVLGPLLFIQVSFLQKVAFEEKYRVVLASGEKAADMMAHQEAMAKILGANYDYGKILMTRATQDLIVIEAGTASRNYILESNFPYYEQALQAPWFYARWVVMLNNVTESDDPGLLNWVKENEQVAQRWGGNPTFEKFYTLIAENRFERLYKIKEPAVREYVKQNGIQLSLVPSLNPNIRTWDSESKDFQIKIPPEVAVVGEEESQVASQEESQSLVATPVESAIQRVNYVVQKGDTLWNISVKYYGDGFQWKKIATENNITQGNLILPGTSLIIPILSATLSLKP